MTENIIFQRRRDSAAAAAAATTRRRRLAAIQVASSVAFFHVHVSTLELGRRGSVRIVLNKLYIFIHQKF